MRKYLAATALMLLPLVGHATTVPSRDKPIPATKALFTNIPTAENLREGEVTVELGLLSENPKWQMRSPLVPVMVRLLSDTTVARAGPTDNLWKQIKSTEPSYKGLTLRLKSATGQPVQPLRFFGGRVTTESGKLLMEDPGRKLEFWLFGSARIKRDQQMADRALPIFSFDQCRVLGNPIIDTKPRQCLLADGGILLETDEKPTAKSLKATDFDSCLIHGQSLIYTFPRRCVAAGGRVFTEPPRVYEAPEHAVPAEAISVVSDTSITAPSRTVITEETSATEVVSRTVVIEERPGLGTYAVSNAAPVSATISMTIPVSATVEISAMVPMPSPMVVSPSVAVSPITVSASIPVSATISTSVPVSATVAVSETVVTSPTASVSSFEVTLGPVKK